MKLLFNDRSSSVRVLTCLFFLIGVIMSFPLWTSDRLFPLCPVADAIPTFNPSLSGFVAVLLVVLLIMGTLFSYRWIFVALLSIILLLLLQDQMRWQPWVYLYGFLLVPFAIRKHKNEFIPYFQLLLIGVYLWGGLHKFSPEFIEHTFNKILIELFGIENQETIASIQWLGYLIPTIEVSIAAFLFFPKTRLLGVVGVFLTHIFILSYLITVDYNEIVYPWNLAMMVLVLTLFYKNPNHLIIWKRVNVRIRLMHAVALIFFFIMPFFCLFNKWDNYLSFRLYSGKTNMFFIGIAEDEIHKIDDTFQDYFYDIEALSGGEMISLNKWAMEELNVPFYPETRVFKQVAKSFCELDIQDDKLISVEFDRSLSHGDFQQFRCSDLQ